jgi:flagellar export protein FliJ
MSGFHFTLARVLRLREDQLKIEELKLEGLLAQRRQIELEIQTLDSAAQQARLSINREQSVHVVELVSLEHFTDRMNRECKDRRTKLAVQDGLIEQQRKALSEARTRVRLLEKLCEKRKAQWVEDRNREEQAQVGDFSAAQWLRSQRDLGRRKARVGPGQP